MTRDRTLPKFVKTRREQEELAHSNHARTECQLFVVIFHQLHADRCCNLKPRLISC